MGGSDSSRRQQALAAAFVSLGLTAWALERGLSD